MVINDFLRGKIPWYITDPAWPERKPKEKDEEFEGREGRLGEMRKQFGQDDAEEGETDTRSWDGLNAEEEFSEGNGEKNDEQSGGSDEDGQSEEERIEDPRPSKRIRR